MRRFASLLRFLVLAAVVAPAAFAQGGSIRGKVIDSTGTAIVAATISIDALGLRAMTDDQGGYAITRIPAGTHLVRARRIGYATRAASVAVVDGKRTTQDFTLGRVPASLGAVAVIGSRAEHTAAAELAVPVDVFTPALIQQQGTNETGRILAQLSPSVNFNQQSVSDGTEIMRPFTMRGLSPDHSLVLVNGKRRHHSAIINYYGAGMGAGSSGIDINAIPSSSIERMEVLRDGAAAQYGSDAIAGVVNLVLKEGVFAPSFTVDLGQYLPKDWPHDGRSIDIAGSQGFAVGRGSLAVMAEYRVRGATNRAGPDNSDQFVAGDADEIVDDKIIKKNNAVAQPNHHWGDGSERAALAFINARYPLGAGDATAYAFGGFSLRDGTGFGYYRQPMSERNWLQIYPSGFLPKFAPVLIDGSGSAGVRGTAGAWHYDAGGTFGYNSFAYNLENSLNTSLGPCLTAACAPGLDGKMGTADDPGMPNQTSFHAGTLKLNEAILSLDADRKVDIGLHAPASLAVGIAVRREGYEIVAGEKASWIQGGYPTRYGDIAPSGSQVFPGYRPEDASVNSRSNVGAYGELESALSTTLMANAAARFEHYSDFGDKLTGKLAMRWQPAKTITFRGAASTGFRAPSLAQSHYSSVSTNFRADPVTGKPMAFEVGIYPVASAEARALGARPLTAETSVNISGGLAWSPTDRLNFTADYFHIAVNDRIMLTTVLASDAVADILNHIGSRAEAAQYFTNAVNTRSNGLDVTGSYKRLMGPGLLDLTGTFNYTETKVVGDIPVPAELANAGVVLFDEFGEGGLLAVTRERPRWRATLTTQYQVGNWRALLRASHYDKYTSALYGYCAACAQTYGAQTILDAELGYTLPRGMTVTIGARNLLDTFPPKMVPENSFGLFPYPSASPYGFNGRYLYSRFELPLGH